MKKVIYILALFILSFSITFIIASCNQQQVKPNEGAWNLVDWQVIAGDTVAEKFEDFTGSQIKMWSGDHFIFVGRYKKINDTTYSDTYGGGTYTLDGNHYVETVLYHDAHEWINSKPKMLLEVKGDSLIQTFPVDTNWQINKSNYVVVEKYIRLK